MEMRPLSVKRFCLLKWSGILHAGQQTILYLNRRGTSRILCFVPSAVMSPDVPGAVSSLTYHSAN